MRVVIRVLSAVLLTAVWTVGQAQTVQDYENARKPEKMEVQPFKKKFHWAVNVNTYWSSIKGSSLPAQYFAKPSIGLAVTAEYYLKEYLGFSAGLGYQQLGAGIRTNLKYPVTGTEPDSTYRRRLRFNTLVIPLAVNLRTTKDVLFKGCRLSGFVGLTPLINMSSHDVYNSLEPTIRVLDVNTNVSSSYFKSDLLFQLGVGPEIEVGTGIVRIQFIYTQGTANVFSSQQGTGHNQASGIRIAYLF